MRFVYTSILTGMFVLSPAGLNAAPQATYLAGPATRRAALVMTPEFCATKTKKGTWGINQETFEIGKAACAELEPALKTTFGALTRVEDPSGAADAPLVLSPRFVDISASQTALAFSSRELVVLVEWTVKDQAGKTLWVETVQGTARNHMGNAFTHGKNLKKIVEGAVKDMAEQSAKKMAESPELSKAGQ